MNTLTPNAPAKRIEHVIKAHWVKFPEPVIDTVQVASHLVGLDDGATAADALGVLDGTTPGSQIRAIVHRTTVGAGDSFERVATAGDMKRAQDVLSGDAEPQSLSEFKSLALMVLCGGLHKFPAYNENDFLIPWIARELIALMKAVQGKAKIGDIYTDAVEALGSKGPAIALWARETRTDIGKVDLAQALEAIATYQFKTRRVDAGTVVYEYPDGWTVQELRSDRLLKQEGDVMQNCVGGYWGAVSIGESRIYSLRDPSGNPHVDIEWHTDPHAPRWEDQMRWGEMESMGPEEFLLSKYRRWGHVNQVLGKQNDAIVDRYRPYVVEFIKKTLDGDPIGLLLAGVPGYDVTFQNHDLMGETFDGDQRGHEINLNAANLDKAMLPYTTYADGLNAMEATFRNADLRGAEFQRTNLERADFDGADLRNVKFWKTRLYGASMRGANITGASFTGVQDMGSIAGLGDLILGQLNEGAARRNSASSHNPYGSVRQLRDWFDIVYDHEQDEWLYVSDLEARQEREDESLEDEMPDEMPDEL